jgi:hypothetical protein
MLVLVIPLVILGGFNAFLAGIGISQAWMPQYLSLPFLCLPHLFSAALNASWIFPAARHRAPYLVFLAWLLSCHYCHQGLKSLSEDPNSMAGALFLETITLLLAQAVIPSPTWSERLTRWRRARAEISVQLHMGEGVLYWFPPALRRFLLGSSEMPSGTNYGKFVAQLRDAEHSLRIRLSKLAMPEHLRQSILSSAGNLLGQAEKSAACLAIELEKNALAAAAACRDECEDLDGLQPQEKSALGRQCEDLFLDLIHPQCGAPELRQKTA